MIIKVRQTTLTEKEIEINFPYCTYDKQNNRFYYNYDLNKCITISQDTNSILHTRYSNEGLNFYEIPRESFFVAFDENLKDLLNILNK